MKKRLLITLLVPAWALCCFFSPARSTPMNIDSLQRLLKTPSTDSAKVGWYLDISESYLAQQNLPKCEEYIEKALALSTKAGYLRGKASALMHKGYMKLQSGQFPEALELLNKAMAAAKSVNDVLLTVMINNVTGTVYLVQKDGAHALSYYKEAVALLPKLDGVDKDPSLTGNVYLHIGSAYSMINDFQNFAYYSELALKEAEKIGDKNMAMMAAGNLAYANDMLGNYIKGYWAATKLLHYAQQLHDTAGETRAMYFFASVYTSMGDVPKAIEYHKRILALTENGGDITTRISELSNLGWLYEQMGDYERALELYNQSLRMSDSIGNKDFVAAALHNIGACYQQKGDHNKALSYFRQALSMNEKNNRLDFITKNHAGIGSAFYGLKQYDSAFQHYTISLSIAQETGNKDDLAQCFINLGTLNTDQVEDSTSGISGDRKTQMLQAAISQYQKAEGYAKEIGNLGLHEKIYDGFSKAYKLLGDYKTSMDYFKKATAIKDSLFSRQNAFKIARLEADRSLAQKDVLISKSKEEADRLKIQKQRLYGGIGLLIVGTGVGFAGYRLQRKRKEARLKAEFQKKVAEVEMQALRAQMNPHFIFNCLNSINRYIVKSDSVTASGYLTKFSKLIRSILDNSAAEIVTLDAELQILQLYAEMESLRFPDRFTYEISADQALNPNDIYIPPMLVQPYVENAIWHGLMHKEGSGHLSVRFTDAGNSSLQVVIEDNGIGREKASELNSKNALKQKSYGMQITRDRLRIVSQRFSSNASLKIEDLKNENGEALGTRVTILIPFQPAAEQVASTQIL